MPSDEHPTSRQVTTGEQLNRVLAIAEGLLDRAERTAVQCHALRVAEVGVVALAIFVLAGWVGLSQFVGEVHLTVVSIIGVLVSASVAAVIYFLLEAPLRKQLMRDAKVIVEIVGLVQELSPLVARHEEWNELLVQSFNSRVSRIPIWSGGVQ
jgi:hypothetical protein